MSAPHRIFELVYKVHIILYSETQGRFTDQNQYSSWQQLAATYIQNTMYLWFVLRKRIAERFTDLCALAYISDIVKTRSWNLRSFCRNDVLFDVEATGSIHLISMSQSGQTYMISKP